MRHRELTLVLLLLVALPLSASVDAVLAQNSLGIGGSEQAIKPEGMFAGWFFWIREQQQAFYKIMTSALKQMRDGDGGTLLLAGVSFAYGVFHAAGPGHGKAVISSYMLANEVAARRGIALSFASAMLQAVTAILLITALTLVLRGAGIRSGNVVNFMEIASYAGVTALGAWLLYAKISRRGCGNSHNHDYDHGYDHGHHHAADPSKLEGDLGLRDAAGAVLAVGIRPCTGAIVVLTFAFLNGLYVAGIASTFAMAIGTGLTVSTLALMAVGAKNIAKRFSSSPAASGKVHRAIEIIGAGLVFVLGATLLMAALG